MKIDIVTIFPDYFSPLELSLIGRARATGRLRVEVHDLRTWTHDVHRTVDDTPYGGGPGMVMRPEPWGEALDALTGAPVEAPVTALTSAAVGEPDPPAPAAGAPLPPAGGPLPPVGAPRFAVGAPRLVVPTPAGRLFTQSLAGELAREQHLIFACGRYEGIDQRVLDDAGTRMPVTEISIGDYVLFGGEVAVLAILEAVVRLLPGVLGNADSLVEESHAAGLLEAPVYTKPAVWREHAVPEILRSGDHGRIARWRRDQALLRTAERRPDLLAGSGAELDRQDLGVLAAAGFQLSPPDVAK